MSKRSRKRIQSRLTRAKRRCTTHHPTSRQGRHHLREAGGIEGRAFDSKTKRHTLGTCCQCFQYTALSSTARVFEAAPPAGRARKCAGFTKYTVCREERNAQSGLPWLHMTANPEEAAERARQTRETQLGWLPSIKGPRARGCR